jgi:hypothetical protein
MILKRNFHAKVIGAIQSKNGIKVTESLVDPLKAMQFTGKKNEFRMY